jgi:hypothetical protein
MSTQRIYQLLVAVCIITVIAFVSERSRSLAAVVSVMPVNITIALWFVFTSVDGDPGLMANFARMVMLGLIPTALFAVMCWFGFRQGWPLWRVLVTAYAVWLVTIGIYRFVDSWLTKG